MDKASLVCLKFCIEVKPYMTDARQTYISETLFEKIKDIIPAKLKLRARNGDLFEGHFNGSKQCFVGFRELLKRYIPADISLLQLELVEEGIFIVTVFDLTAIEIEYPTKAEHVLRKDVDFRRVPHIAQYNFNTVRSLKDNLRSTLLHYNARDCNVLKANIYMPEQYYQGFIDFVRLEELDEDLSRKWVDGSSLSLTAGNSSWTVIVNKKNDQWFITKGWMKFATDIGVNCSDMIELCFATTHFTAEVVFYKDYACVPTCVEKQLERPSHFFKIVTELFLRTGEMTIPCLYHWKYGKELDAEVEILVASSAIYKVLYLEFEQKLVQLKDFVTATKLQVGYTLIFCQVSRSQVSVRIYDSHLLEIVV